METEYLIISLTDIELKEVNGGFPRLDPISLFDPFGSLAGFFEGWRKSTQF